MSDPKDPLTQDVFEKMLEEINQNASVPTMIYFPELDKFVDTEEK